MIIANGDHQEASITGWSLEGDDGGAFVLSGTVPAGGALTIRLGDSLQLGNGGDTIFLKNASGDEVHSISYGSASEGQFMVAE